MNDLMKYYLIYYEDNAQGELYAYTSIKDEAKEFVRYRRNMKLKTREVGLSERKYLSSMQSLCRIQSYQFRLSNILFSLPLTYDEVLYIESIQTKVDILLTGAATINPMIFNKKIMKDLETIRYTEFFLKYRIGTNVDLDDDRFLIFIRGFGETLNMKKIENEVIV